MIGSVPLEEFSYGLDLSGADPASLNDALRAVTLDVMSDPIRMSTIVSGLMLAQQGVAMNALRRMQGDNPPPAVDVAGDDPLAADDLLHVRGEHRIVAIERAIEAIAAPRLRGQGRNDGILHQPALVAQQVNDFHRIARPIAHVVSYPIRKAFGGIEMHCLLSPGRNTL